MSVQYYLKQQKPHEALRFSIQKGLMPQITGIKLSSGLTTPEIMLVLATEERVNTACLLPGQSDDVVVRISPLTIEGRPATKKILTELTRMHAVVNERTTFERKRSYWNFTVHYQPLRGVVSQWQT